MQRSHGLILGKDIVNSKHINIAIGIAFFVLATALGAFVRIPVKGSPVPITLQTFFVVLSGALLGKRGGVLSQASYLALGVMGMPVFQGAGYGTAGLFGPTGGYLIGFMAASYITGRMTDPGCLSFGRTVLCFAIGHIAIYSFGILWLSFFYGVPLLNSLSIGLLPFVPGDMAKILLAAVIYTGISRRSKVIFSA